MYKRTVDFIDTLKSLAHLLVPNTTAQDLQVTNFCRDPQGFEV